MKKKFKIPYWPSSWNYIPQYPSQVFIAQDPSFGQYPTYTIVQSAQPEVYPGFNQPQPGFVQPQPGQPPIEVSDPADNVPAEEIKVEANSANNNNNNDDDTVSVESA
jgi:hypothetical protein